MNLDDVAMKEMTVRDVLRQVFKDDWNARRNTLELVPGMTFHVTLHLRIGEIPPDLARSVLQEVMEEEGQAMKKPAEAGHLVGASQ